MLRAEPGIKLLHTTMSDEKTGLPGIFGGKRELDLDMECNETLQSHACEPSTQVRQEECLKPKVSLGYLVSIRPSTGTQQTLLQSLLKTMEGMSRKIKSSVFNVKQYSSVLYAHNKAYEKKVFGSG